MKNGVFLTLALAICGFFLLLPVAGSASIGDSRTAGTPAPRLNLPTPLYQNQQREGVQLASAAVSATQLLPEEAKLPPDISKTKAGKVIVYKSERRMDLLDKAGNPLRSYQISLGKNPVGTKVQQGDNRTPEGLYHIEWRNPQSAYHLSLKISYPSPADRWQAQKVGLNPGGDIFIHGLPNGRGWKKWRYGKGKDWTNGCIAVYDHEMREIWDLVPDGTPILIKP